MLSKLIRKCILERIFQQSSLHAGKLIKHSIQRIYIEVTNTSHVLENAILILYIFSKSLPTENNFY